MSEWERDFAFMTAARLVWPDDTELATVYFQAKGKAAARRKMAARYDGWRLLRSVAALGKACEHAHAQLRGSLTVTEKRGMS